MNTRERKSIDLAIKLARRWTYDGDCKLASVLTSGSQVISVGQNWMHKSHPKSNHPFRFIHSELDALIGISQEQLFNATLFVARVGFHNRSKVMLSKPCIYCQTLIIRSGIRQVYYTISDIITGHWNVKNNEWSEIT